MIAAPRAQVDAMTASSGDDVPTQLAALLGRATVRIRKTDEAPPRISVIDVVQAMTGNCARHAAQEVRTLCSRYPEVDQILVHFLFRGQGQRKTYVTSVRGIVEVVMLLQGQQAARVRRQAAELLCRWLGGDMAIIDEVCGRLIRMLRQQRASVFSARKIGLQN